MQISCSTELRLTKLWWKTHYSLRAMSGQVRSGQARSLQVRSGQVRSDQIRSNLVWSGLVWSGQVRSGQVRSDEVRSGGCDKSSVPYLWSYFVYCCTLWNLGTNFGTLKSYELFCFFAYFCFSGGQLLRPLVLLYYISVSCVFHPFTQVLQWRSCRPLVLLSDA